MVFPQARNRLQLFFEHRGRKHIFHPPLSGQHPSTLPGLPFLIPIFVNGLIGMRWRELEMGQFIRESRYFGSLLRSKNATRGLGGKGEPTPIWETRRYLGHPFTEDDQVAIAGRVTLC